MKAGMKALWAALLLAGPLLAGCDKGAEFLQRFSDALGPKRTPAGGRA